MNSDFSFHNPDANDLEEKVVSFIATSTGERRDLILRTSRLLHDLGMDGHDAVDFFDEFSEEFSVDISVLRSNWGEYFGPEGGPSPGCLIVLLASTLLGIMLHVAFQNIAWWAFTIGLALLLGWAYVRFSPVIEPSRMLPITVADLVNAARTGKWVRCSNLTPPQ